MTSEVCFYLSIALYRSSHYCRVWLTGKFCARLRWVLKTALLLSATTCALAPPLAYSQTWQMGKPYTIEASSPVPRIAIADLDGDGIGDVALIVSGKLQVLRGDDSKGFSPFQPQINSPGNSVMDLAVGDFNGDGNVDLVIIGTDTVGGLPRLYLLAGKGNGQFEPEIQLEVTGAPALDSFSRLVAGSFMAQQTGRISTDLAITSRSDPGSVLILANDGHGSFSLGRTIKGVSDGRTIIGLSSVSGFGSDNFAIESASSGGGVPQTNLVRNSRGSFTPQNEAGLTGDLTLFADYDGDLIPDQITVVTQSNVTSLFAQRGGAQGLGAPRSVAEWAQCPIEAIAAGALSVYSNSRALDLVAVRNCSSVSSNVGELSLIGLWNTAKTRIETLTRGNKLTPGMVDIDVLVAARDGKGVPTGDVGISIDGGPMQVSPLLSGVGHITANLGQEAYSIQSVYEGSDEYAASTKNKSLTLPRLVKATSTRVASIKLSEADRSNTATTLTVTSGGSIVLSTPSGNSLTLTATVTANGIVLTSGLVNFCDAAVISCTDIHRLGSAQLTGAGSAVMKFIPTIGNHSYKANFTGTTECIGSSSSVSTLTVNGKYPTTTTIAQTGYPGNYTLTAAVVGVGPWSTHPTGTISFLDTSERDSVLATATLGNGMSSLDFSNSSIPSGGNGLGFAAIGDFNGDGIPDMAVAHADSNTVTVMLGNGDGTFAAASVLATGAYPGSVSIGDFNADGNLDLAVSNELSNSITVLLGHGDGTFTEAASPTTGTNPTYIAVGDFNGDGRADLAVSNQNSNWITMLLGNGDGTFTAAPNQILHGGSEALTTGDFNGDGNPDLIVVTGLGQAMILLGNGDATFTPTLGPALGSRPGEVVVGDFNGDGKADFAAVNIAGNSLTVALGNGDGTFVLAPNPEIGGAPYSLAIGDFNGDGKPDLAVTNMTTNTVTILTGNGDGTFTATTTNPTTGSTPTNIRAGDFDGNGTTDLAVSNLSSGTLSILLTKVTQMATAMAPAVSPLGAGTHQIEASYPGDAVYDSSISGTTGLLVNKVTPVLRLSTSLSPSMYGQSVTFTCAAVANGRVVIDGTSLAFSIGGEQIGSDTTINGVATWTTSSLQVGSYNVGCSGGDSNYNPAQQTIIQVVRKTTNVSVSIVSSKSPSTFADNVTLTITVAGSASTPTGTVTLSYKNAVLGSPALNAIGVASYSTSALPVGADSLTVTYSGDNNYE